MAQRLYTIGTQTYEKIRKLNAPLLNVAHEDQNFGVLRNVKRNIYSSLKKCENMLRFED